MIIGFNKKTSRKRAGRIAFCLALLFIAEIVTPTAAFALSGGPSQPEFSGFAQASATDMVDLFTGDFKYNLPLFDIDGYPVNLSYNAGPGMEQEASWVGLGWNLNPGMVSRTVRGIPDDFNGEEVTEQFHSKDMYTFSIGEGGGVELTALELGVGQALNFHSETGFSIGRDASIGYDFGPVNAGVSIASSRASGITFTPYVKSSPVAEDPESSVSVGLSASFNSRNGLQNIGIFSSATMAGEKGTSPTSFSPMGVNFPIGQSSYFPSQAPGTKSNSFSLDVKLGFAIKANDGNKVIKSSGQTITSNDDAVATKAYGYLYHQNAGAEGLTDFNRDGDAGHFTSEMDFLSPSALMPDGYAVVGQGISGSLRPYRMETSSFSDPSKSSNTGGSASLGLEINPLDVIDVGGDVTIFSSELAAGPWPEVHDAYKAYEQEDSYLGQPVNSLEQNLLFYKTGELRPVNNYYFKGTNNPDPDYGELNVKQFGLASYQTLNSNYTNLLPERHSFPESDPHQRLTRNEHLQMLTAKEAELVGLNKVAPDYKLIELAEVNNTSFEIPHDALEDLTELAYTASGLDLKDHKIAEILSYSTDGSRYVFGIPAMNKSYEQRTFSSGQPSPTDLIDSPGMVTYDDGTDAIAGNDIGDQYFQKKSYGAYAHSFLLTGYLGPDYVDLTQNGITDDDLGTAVRFNWTKTTNAITGDFKWRLPMDQEERAEYIQARLLDETDDKATYTYGTKDLWYAHSIESKNHVAFFILGNRKDALGANGPEGGVNIGVPMKKLEEIRIYTKDEWARYDGTTAPIPTKVIEFHYDYSQCADVPNFDASVLDSDGNLMDISGQSGKLTLKEVIIKHGASDKGSLSPYVFEYNDLNPDYNKLAVDRWGYFKGENPIGPDGIAQVGYQDYPYVFEAEENGEFKRNQWASAWSLKQVTLPSGATIKVTYESDDYALVQDKKAQMMFQVLGFGGDDCNYSLNLHKGDRKSSLKQMYMYVLNPYSDDQDLEASDFYDVDDPESWLYFRCKVKLPGKDGGSVSSGNAVEDVRGYAKISDIQLCGGNKLRLTLKSVAFNEKGDLIHPVLKAALDYTYTNYQGLLYGGMNPNSGTLENTIKNIVAIKDDLMSMFLGAYNHMINKGIAKSIEGKTSYVRLNQPYGKRLGEGHRVKKIELSDNWAQVGTSSTSYGQEYFYETVEGGTSGIASYEPMQGNDENPHKKPHYYSTDDSNSKKPKPYVYQEEPFGEMFLPSASVGYSRVVVKPLKFDESKSSGQYTEHAFYTALDFPFKVEVGKIEKDHLDDPGSATVLGYGHSESFGATTQGFVYVLNDMHGKPRYEKTVYAEKNYTEETLKRTDYLYQTNEDGSLSNDVEAIDRNGDITQVTMGMDVDLNVDSKFIEKSTLSQTLQVNVKAFKIETPFIPIILPLILPKEQTTKLEYRTAVVTKQIFQRGILKSIKYQDGNLQTVLTNDLYDAETGQVVKTSQSSNYAGKNREDLQWEVKYPAYFAEHKMGHTYRNDGFVGKIGEEQPFMSSVTYTNDVKVDHLSFELMASIIYQGYMDGMDRDEWGPGLEKYDTLSGNLVPEGVFVEGDEVMVVDDNAEFGDRYHVAEVLTADELTALLALTPSPPSNILSGWTPPTSGAGNNTTSTYTGGTVPTVLCNGEAIDHAIIEDIFNKVITLSGATYDYSMLPINYQSTGAHYAAVKDYLEAHDALRFYDIWNPTGSYQEDYYHLVSQLLMDSQTRDFLAYLDFWGQDSPLSQSATPSENEGIRMQALLYILQCNEMRTCLVDACGNSSIVQVLEGLFQFQDGSYPVHGLMAISMAANWDDHYIAFTEATGSQDLSCDFQNNLYFNSGYDYGLKTYSDFFNEANDVVVLNAGSYTATNLASNPSFSNGSATNYTQQVFSMVNGTYSSANSFGVVNLSCEAMGYDPTWSLNHYACDDDILVAPGTYNEPDPNDENPTPDPDPPIYNTPTIGEVAMFIDEDGVIEDMDGKTVKIIRSGRRNMLSAQVGSESFIENDEQGGDPDFHTMLAASAMHYKDEWASDFFTDSEADNTFNAFLTGHRGIFRPHLTYQPNGDRYYDDERNALKDGLITDYSPYWSYYDEGNGNYVYNRIDPNTNAENENWVLTEEFTNYSATGAAIESKNALDIYSTLIQSRNNHMLAEGVNVSHRQILVENFESYDEANGLVISHGISGANETLTGTGVDYLTKNDAHSGEWCMALKGTIPTASTTEPFDALPSSVKWTWDDIIPDTEKYDDDFYRIKGFAPSGAEYAGKYTISFWTKSGYYFEPNGVDFNVAFNPAVAPVSAHVTLSSGGSITNTLIASNTGQMIDGWQRMQLEFTIDQADDELEITFYPGDFGCLVDDLRIYPSEGKILTYVYDKTYRRLAASLDENNLATFFKYDQDGALMKTERETENGRLTIKEQYKSSRVITQ